MPTEPQYTEGRLPFPLALPPSSPPTHCETYYKVFGPLPNPHHPPVVVVHGGPGSGHNYLLAFRHLWTRHNLTVIFYDGLGTAQSTHLPQTKHDHAFWTIDLLVRQLDSLIAGLHLADDASASAPGTGFHLLGHSVGGMIAACYAARHRPPALRNLVLANAPGSIDLHLHGMQLWAASLPDAPRQALNDALRTRDWNAQEYRDAQALLNSKHWCRADPWPEELLQTQRNHMMDGTVTETMWGAAPYDITGSLNGWDCYSDLPNINVPTLLYHGEWDIDRHEVVAPYVERIPGIRKVTIAGASHMTHLEDEGKDQVLELVGSFFLSGK